MVRRRILTLLTLITALLLVLTAIFILSFWIPNKRLADPDWWRTTSPEEMRSTAHWVLRFPVGNHHDAFLVLYQTGNAESVPLLIRALRWHNVSGEDFIPCTTEHCLDALRNLTGHDAGATTLEWRAWWKETGSKQDPKTFYPRADRRTAEDREIS